MENSPVETLEIIEQRGFFLYYLVAAKEQANLQAFQK